MINYGKAIKLLFVTIITALNGVGNASSSVQNSINSEADFIKIEYSTTKDRSNDDIQCIEGGDGPRK